MGKLGWKIRFNRFISSFPFTTGILPPFFHVERKGKKGERKSPTRVETEKRIDDIHTHIYIYTRKLYIRVERIENRSQTLRGVVHPKKANCLSD